MRIERSVYPPQPFYFYLYDLWVAKNLTHMAFGVAIVVKGSHAIFFPLFPLSLNNITLNILLYAYKSHISYEISISLILKEINGYLGKL